MNFKNLMGEKTVRRSNLNKVRDAWSPQQITKRRVMEKFDYVIDAGNMTGFSNSRFWYTAGVYGWNADVITIKSTSDVCIVAGYRAFGNIKAPSDLCNEYEEKAQATRNSDALWDLATEFAEKVLEREGLMVSNRKVVAAVSDSRRVKDSLDEDNEYLLEHIGDLLEEGYRSGYDPQWDLDITVDGQDISEFNDDDRDLIYQDIAYVVKDGYDNYHGIETELSDGSIVYVDFVLNY